MSAVATGKIDAAEVAFEFLADLPREIVVSVKQRDFAEDLIDDFQPRRFRHQGIFISNGLGRQGKRHKTGRETNDE